VGHPPPLFPPRPPRHALHSPLPVLSLWPVEVRECERERERECVCVCVCVYILRHVLTEFICMYVWVCIDLVCVCVCLCVCVCTFSDMR
jgi:hypothetical protein